MRKPWPSPTSCSRTGARRGELQAAEKLLQSANILAQEPHHPPPHPPAPQSQDLLRRPGLELRIGIEHVREPGREMREPKSGLAFILKTPSSLPRDSAGQRAVVILSTSARPSPDD
ncbi:MAG: hypothetical protein OEY13_11850 [Gammaproteobacteria bacterium]|nr:hypothetical protein [Gammaproteobacteria bacterium]